MTTEPKNYFVTGGGSGLGKATCELLVERGNRVAVVDLREEAAQAVAAELNERVADSAVAVACDVANAQQVERAFADAEAGLSGINGVVNCAGIALGEGSVVDCSEDAWDKTMAVNLKSIFLTGKYGVPRITKSGGGAIVNIASVFGFVVNKDECAYAASKGAVINLTRQMAVDFAKDNIRVNAICPADADTPLIEQLLGVHGDELEAAKAELAAPIPMGHLTKPVDVARAIAFLLSDDSSFITGVSLPVDGGFLVQ